MFHKVVLVALVAGVVADKRPPPYDNLYDGSHDDDHYVRKYPSTYPKYNFDYKVKDYYGNDFGHKESRDGYDTEGEYFVHLPDGRLQTVTDYIKKGSGYVTDVHYDGQPKYPDHSYEYSKSYYSRSHKGYKSYTKFDEYDPYDNIII